MTAGEAPADPEEAAGIENGWVDNSNDNRVANVLSVCMEQPIGSSWETWRTGVTLFPEASVREDTGTAGHADDSLLFYTSRYFAHI